MLTNKQNQRIVFLESINATEVAFDILKRNGIGETVDEAHNKIKLGKIPKVIILNNIVRDIANGKISIDKSASEFQKQLETTEEIAKKIVEDVKKELLPFAVKVTPEEDEIEEEVIPEKEAPTGSEVFTKIKPPIGIKLEDQNVKENINFNNLEKQTKQPIKSVGANNNLEEIRKTNIKDKKQSSKTSTEKIEKIQNKPKGQPDKYRELVD